jgi:nucleotide-binding universal stress UspA family protein
MLPLRDRLVKSHRTSCCHPTAPDTLPSFGCVFRLTFQSHLVSGDSRVALAELAEKLKAEAVVVGCHGRSAIGRAILGSTSTWLSHHCKRPVVIVRPDEDQSAADGGKTA